MHKGILEGENMILEKIRVGEVKTNCYIFGDSDTKDVVVIDPADEGKAIFDLINENGYKVKYIVITHGHFDHIGAVEFLKEQTGAQVLVHRIDGEMIEDPEKNFSLFGFNGGPIKITADRLLEDNDEVTLGNSSFKIIHTPGHTIGSICVLYEDSLFSGDTLFKETVGRTDLPYSDQPQMITSIKKLMNLDDNIKVFPGHGDSSDMKHEKMYNPFMK